MKQTQGGTVDAIKVLQDELVKIEEEKVREGDGAEGRVRRKGYWEALVKHRSDYCRSPASSSFLPRVTVGARGGLGACTRVSGTCMRAPV